MIEQVIEPREVTLMGDLRVKRILPFRARRAVGPFTFLDEMGPVALRPGSAGDVPPHPHIGLSTVTYLFDGELVHRDSLGSKQAILPGDVNWMTAGSGIAHSERIPPELRTDGRILHGMQAWVALPKEREEIAPSFEHYDRNVLPVFSENGVRFTLIAGEAFGRRSPVQAQSPLFYYEAALAASTSFELAPGEGWESAFYLARGEISVDGQRFDRPTLLVFGTGSRVRIHSESGAHGLALGGPPLDGPRFIWWNFVSSSQERIERAKQDWREQRLPKIPEETEWVPLPGEAAPTDQSSEASWKFRA